MFDRVVCQVFFAALWGVGCPYIRSLQRVIRYPTRRLSTCFLLLKVVVGYDRSGAEVPVDKPRFRSSRKGDDVCVWLNALAAIHEHQPDSAQIHLAHAHRNAVYEEYMRDVDEGRGFNPVAPQHFFRLWRQHCDHIKIRKYSRFSVCSDCDDWRHKFSMTRDQPVRLELQKVLVAHLKLIRAERLQYHTKRTKARTDPTQFLSIIIDGADQARYKIPSLHTKVMDTDIPWGS